MSHKQSFPWTILVVASLAVATIALTAAGRGGGGGGGGRVGGGGGGGRVGGGGGGGELRFQAVDGPQRFAGSITAGGERLPAAGCRFAAGGAVPPVALSSQPAEHSPGPDAHAAAVAGICNPSTPAGKAGPRVLAVAQKPSTLPPAGKAFHCSRPVAQRPSASQDRPTLGNIKPSLWLAPGVFDFLPAPRGTVRPGTGGNRPGVWRAAGHRRRQSTSVQSSGRKQPSTLATTSSTVRAETTPSSMSTIVPGGDWTAAHGNWADHWYGHYVPPHYRGWYHGCWNGNWGNGWYGRSSPARRHGA